MATFFTKTLFQNYARAKDLQSRTWLSESRLFSLKDDAKFDIFLSHSFLDKEVVKGVYAYLTALEYRVYVDWIIDPEFNRSEVDVATVDQLRKRMRQSSSLIYAVSDQASTSKWMPWELGFMDGYTSNRCAILPILDISTQSYVGQEFIHVYPKVTKEDMANGNFKMTVQRKNLAEMNLSDWQRPSGIPYRL